VAYKVHLKTLVSILGHGSNLFLRLFLKPIYFGAQDSARKCSLKLASLSKHSTNQHGFILLPVILTLTILAAIAYQLNREGAINTGNVNREHKQDTALYIAQAGYNHAIWKINRQNCLGYTDIPDTTFAGHNYLASYTDTTGTTLTAGSPANIKVVGTSANGNSYTINRHREKIYQFPIQQIVFQPDSSSGIDTYLYEWKKTWNYGQSTTLWVRNNWANSFAYSLFNFDISSIPAEAKFISATLELWQNTPSANGGTVAIRAITNDWVEGLKVGGIGSASWNERDSGIDWTNTGGDYSSLLFSSTFIPAATIGWYQWDIANLVSNWLSGATINQGFILTPESTNTYVEFNSSDSADPTLRPKLTITYTCECGIICESVTPPPAKKIYWTDDIANKVQRSDEDGSNVEDIIIALNVPTGLDIDTVNGKIYWTNRREIQRSNLNGSNIETIYTEPDVINTFDIKLDVAGDKMYWTYDNFSRVMRANLDGSNSEIINSTLDGNAYISLDKSAGYIYLTGFGDGSVSRMNQDGTNIVTLLTGPVGIVGNAIDLINNKIYWSGGATSDWIKRANLDGSNEETILTGLNAAQDIAHDADNNRIYWVEALVNPVVKRANADGTNVETIVNGLTRPRGLIIVNADLVPGFEPFSCNGSYLDNFNIDSYSNQNGDLFWTTNWIEINESDGPNLGDTLIWSDTGHSSLRLRDNDGGGEGVEREVNLSGASTATLSLLYRRNKLDSIDDRVTIYISSNGATGPWSEIIFFAGGGTDSDYVPFSLDISSFISENTRIRLLTSSTMGGARRSFF